MDLEDLEAIQSSAQRATSITRKLLGFSRKADLQVAPAQLGAVVSNLFSMLRTLLPESIDLEMEISESDAFCLVDVGSIEQILLNLVANARDALPDGGRVDIRVTDVVLSTDYRQAHPGAKPGPSTCVEVTDDGTGSEARSGRGPQCACTLMRLYLPTCNENGACAFPEDAVVNTQHVTGTILVVEDEESLRTVTSKVLEANGFEVLSAADGPGALAILADHHATIDLVLSDMVLPGMSGIALMEWAHAQYGGIRFVLTSGYSSLSLQSARKLDPSIPFIRKPWTLEKLLAEAFPEAKVVAMSGGGPLSKEPVLQVASVLGSRQVLSKPFTAQEVLDTVALALAQE